LGSNRDAWLGRAGYWPCPRLAPRRLTGARLRRL